MAKLPVLLKGIHTVYCGIPYSYGIICLAHIETIQDDSKRLFENFVNLDAAQFAISLTIQ